MKHPGQALTQAEHALNGLHGLAAHFLGHIDHRPLVLQRIIDFLERVHLHIIAFVAVATNRPFADFGRNGIERLAFTLPLYLVQDACFGGNDELLVLAFYAVLQNDCRGTHHVGQYQHRTLALWMGQHDGIGMLFLET